MKIPHKINIELTYDTAISCWGLHLKELKAGNQRDTGTAIFIAVLFRWSKVGSNSRIYNTLMDFKNMVYTYSGMFLALKREGNW